MIVLCDSAEDGFVGIRRGIASVLEIVGFPCYMYNMASKPPLDAFYDLKPNLYLGSKDLHTKGVEKALIQYHCPNHYLDDVQPAFDSVNLKDGTVVPSLECDISYIGNPITGLVEMMNGYRFKLFGNVSWGVPQYLGSVDDSIIPDIYASSRISLAFSDEDALRIAGCGGEPYLMDKHTSRNDFHYTLDVRMANDKTKERLKIRSIILDKATYFNRVFDVLRTTGFFNEAEKLWRFYENSRL